MKPGLAEAYAATVPRLGGMTLEEFEKRVAGFKVHPIAARDGSGKAQVCGAILVSGNEIHACILPWAKGKWFGRKAARVLNDVIDEFGSATTRATTEEGRAFVEALGFEKDGEIYRSTKKWVLNRYSGQSRAQSSAQ